VLAMQVNELCRLVQEDDYHTALQEIQSDVLKAHVTTKARLAIQGAERRSCMKMEDAGKALQSSGFRLGDMLRKHATDGIWQCAEYLLTMRNDLKSGAFDNFIRKLTPLLTNLFELYLAKLGKDVRKNGVNSRGRWDISQAPQEWRDILDANYLHGFKDGSNLASENMLPLIRNFGDAHAVELAEMLRETEKKVRNLVAHEIVPFGREDLHKELQSTRIPTPEVLADRLQEFVEIIQAFSDDYWNSYDSMNKHICNLLKSE